LHRNSWTLAEQRFSTRFQATDAAVRDGGLRPAALLCMLRVAFEHAVPEAANGWRLRDVTWAAPIPAGVEVHLGVYEAAGAVALELYSESASGRLVHAQAHAQARAFDAA